MYAETHLDSGRLRTTDAPAPQRDGREVELQLREDRMSLERRSWQADRQSWERERDLLHALVDALKTNPVDSLKYGRQVGVFWPVDDKAADGSPLLSRSNLSEHVSQLRELARPHGQLSSIKAYTGVTDDRLNTLSALGVELRTCQSEEDVGSIPSHVYLDAMQFALASPLPPSQITLVIALADVAYLPLVAKLRMIGCNVILAARHLNAGERLLWAIASEIHELDLPFAEPGDFAPLNVAADDQTIPEESVLANPPSINDSTNVEPADPTSISHPHSIVHDLDPSTGVHDAEVERPASTSSLEAISHTTTAENDASRSASGWQTPMSSIMPSDLVVEDATGSSVKAPEDPPAIDGATQEALEADEGQEDASPDSPGGWDLDPIAHPASAHESYKGEGWGVPPPPSHKKAAPISTLDSHQRSNGNLSTSSSSSANGASSSAPRAPPVPIGQFTASAWPILRTQPVFPPSPPPPPPEPTRSYPETHNRQPTYVHAPSPVPSLPNSQARSSASTPPATGSHAFRPLLQTVASFPAQSRPLRTICAVALIKAQGGDSKAFYSRSGYPDWKSYVNAAEASGFVQTGDGKETGHDTGREWIGLTDLGRQALAGDGPRPRTPAPPPPARPISTKPLSSPFEPLLNTIASSPPSRPRPLQSRCEISLLKRHAFGDAAAFWTRIGHRDFKTYVYAAEVAGLVQTGFTSETENQPWLGNEWIGLTDLGRRTLVDASRGASPSSTSFTSSRPMSAAASVRPSFAAWSASRPVKAVPPSSADQSAYPSLSSSPHYIAPHVRPAASLYTARPPPPHQQQQHPTPSPFTPAETFKPLLHLLALNHAGDPRPLRANVGESLVRSNPRIYKDRGYAGWRVYAAAAEAEGLVVMGSGERAGADWVGLTEKGRRVAAGGVQEEEQ